MLFKPFQQIRHIVTVEKNIKSQEFSLSWNDLIQVLSPKPKSRMHGDSSSKNYARQKNLKPEKAYFV